MMPYTFKKPTGTALLFALTLFFLFEGLAWSGPSATATTQNQRANNIVTAPMPAKPVPSPTGTSKAQQPIQSPLNNAASSNAGSFPSACPLALGTGPGGDIRDIRGPIHIPDPRSWLLYALGSVLLLFLGWAAVKWFSKRQASRLKSAVEIAFLELEKAKALMVPEKAERFSVMVSGTIRTYIEKRFNMRATRKTTREFIKEVAAEPTSALNPHGPLLKEFLFHCDLAKFARHRFSVSEMERMHESAWRFVNETKPEPEEKTAEKRGRAKEPVAAGTDGIKGRKGFFKGGFLDHFPWKAKSRTQGFNGNHQVAAAGGR